MIAEAAAHEWDTTVPRRPLPRQRFIDWHVRMAENAERRVNRLRASPQQQTETLNER